MDGINNALMGAMADVIDNVWTVGIFTGICAGNLQHLSPHDHRGILTGFRHMVIE